MNALARSPVFAAWPPRPWRLVAALSRPRRRPGAAGVRVGSEPALQVEAPSPAERLSCTYAGSLLEVALQLEALRDGKARPQPQVLSPTRLMEDVAADLRPLAQAAGLRLLLAPPSGGAAEWRADAALLRLALRHLVLRALVGEVTSGAVRMDLALSGRELRMRVLSRAGQPPTRQRALDGVSELSAIQRLLAATGGALLIEPRRGGYAPLTLVLRTADPKGDAAALRQEAA